MAKTVYKQLRAACLPLMTHFKADLVAHDRRTLRRHGGTPFLHWTRQLGTHLLLLIAHDEFPPAGQCVPFLFGTADRNHLLDQAVSAARCWTEPCNGTVVAVHYFNGHILRKIDVHKATEIARQYAVKIRREWLQAFRHADKSVPSGRAVCTPWG